MEALVIKFKLKKIVYTYTVFQYVTEHKLVQGDVKDSHPRKVLCETHCPVIKIHKRTIFF